MKKQKQIHAYFSGKVQGVGFRYRCTQYADQLELKGWVRNLPDKRVELLAEGDSKNVNVLLERLQERFEVNSLELASLPYSGEFRRFEVIRV